MQFWPPGKVSALRLYQLRIQCAHPLYPGTWGANMSLSVQFVLNISESYELLYLSDATKETSAGEAAQYL